VLRITTVHLVNIVMQVRMLVQVPVQVQSAAVPIGHRRIPDVAPHVLRITTVPLVNIVMQV